MSPIDFQVVITVKVKLLVFFQSLVLAISYRLSIFRSCDQRLKVKLLILVLNIPWRIS